MQPFTVAWDEADLRRLRQRVRDYRFPVAPENAGWRYGCDPEFLRRLCAYWVDGFDVRAAEAKLNRFPQVLHRVENIDIHAVHVVGEAGCQRPLLLTHGWPGSVFEFWEAIEPLAFPSRHGGEPEDAFDLVIPSLPGFGVSGKPRSPVGARTAARLFDALMRDGFGYWSYLAQGGDWGAAGTAWLALEHAGSVRAIHLNSVLVQPDAEPDTDEEKSWRTSRTEAENQFGGYEMLQRTRPHSLSYAMQDNPVAQAAWIVERLHDWADLRERPFGAVFTMDQLLTEVMIYVTNDAFATAAWFYAGAQAEHANVMPKGLRVEVPTAIAAHPDPRAPFPPRSWLERGYDVVRWTELPRGGHFVAMEVPELFVADVRAWARDHPGG
ncbi:epoxide hydrolase family protein [Mycobacterium sp. AZCC_0083]|uniref:epoxide hydrolase family protein n=1 Tax=Mycobacterium sp. AZCC_0083 TaxID=2735882 RepID=UPI00160FC658|nr:epoxide hydrolase family protein [Mycobacterium sp. AZCC_0083]MBB5163216.1 pimeloyl-ACP methyl ester carboxylesterase [Mycobacterium sp. AZCC_0083]